MLFFVVRRLGVFAVSLVGASIVIFALLSLLPGDPAQIILGQQATPERLETLRAELGLDRPWPVRYADWATGVAQGDFGESYLSGAAIGPMIAQRLQVTIPLAALGMVLALVLAVPLGITAAARHRGAGDVLISGASQIGIAIPAFWAGILLVTVFAVRLGWLPSGGFTPVTEDPVAWARSMVLPALSLAIVQAAILTRYIRSSILEVMREDFVRTARAKGLTRGKALFRHGLRNAAIPVVTILGLQFAFLFAGTIVIENVFFLPGLGRMVLQAASERDLLLVQGTVMVLTFAILFINLVVDVAYRVIDPRLRSAS
ncbi:ABC transporter permease [Egibacter rhizosphaerae]|uniref:ABC transporter permease n=1 Tax=Egibacter rhizosphaerae TaxID=1670831 RepID=A0A411YJI2_9ACTN|nr:ABC transporter permease [Egibacter rhizosphaerae]QBI21321.1 ABC transporter permease [Egibacter rhizosphaerae]